MTNIMIISVALTSLFSICIGFTVDLIHRDSHQSPSFNPSSSPSQRLSDSLLRSYNRVRILNSRSSSSKNQQWLPQPDIINSDGEYFMKYSVGTPPVPSLGSVDTASDLTWTQCQPCRQCFNQTLPIFNPGSSSTYRRVRCNNPKCNLFQGLTSCGKNKINCFYSLTYADGSFSDGTVAADTITVAAAAGGGVVSVPGFVFGCGNRNSNDFPSGQSGVVGLGGGEGSFVRQLGPLADGKFSYCLVPLSDTSATSSKLKFGPNGVVSGRGVVSTPLVWKKPETFYYLTLKGISVGDKWLGFYEAGSRAEEGNIIIDSGTTLTLLPPGLYARLEEAMMSVIKLKTTKDPLGVLGLCYVSWDDFWVPKVVFHFSGGDVWLERDNLFVRTDEKTVCLAAAPEKGGGAIYGNFAQTNMLVGYDLVKRTVSFKRADCGKI